MTSNIYELTSKNIDESKLTPMFKQYMEIKKKYEQTYASGAYQQQQDKIRDSEKSSREQEEVEADALLSQI